MAEGMGRVACPGEEKDSMGVIYEGDSSESEIETDSSKPFHRRISTNKEIKCSVSVKEGYLMKQTSFQRWRKKYFKLKGRKLYYSKEPKSDVYEEVELIELSIAEFSNKHFHHSFQVTTAYRKLWLAADCRRDMEEWVTALKASAENNYYDNMDHMQSLLSGQHNWYQTSHARPAYCNICREALGGVTSHGYSCEVCKFKCHKKCASKTLNNCKWTSLASVGQDIIEDEEGNLSMPHQWLEGNLPVSAKCAVCEKNCGSVLRLQDWKCLWCRANVHTACRPLHANRCPLGICRLSIVPPTALTTIGTDESWEARRPDSCSPLLVFVNSKSGDNQGVRFLRRFKQLLNPAQVFDLMNGGPVVGLRLFKCFNPFRILICSGDGSISWVLSEIDKLNMANQCQVGILPLGTGNDLARVLGWGSACDDDANLPHVVERYERATTKMLDRWSIMSFMSHMPLSSPKSIAGSSEHHPLLIQSLQYEDSMSAHLSTLTQSEHHSVVVNSAKVICDTVKMMLSKIARHPFSAEHGEDIESKCSAIRGRLDVLLKTLSSSDGDDKSCLSSEALKHSSEQTEERWGRVSPCFITPSSKKRNRKRQFMEREQLVCQSNGLKRTVRELIEHLERLFEEQSHNEGDKTPLSPPQIKLVGDDGEHGGIAKMDDVVLAISTSPPLPAFISSITTTFPLPPSSPRIPSDMKLHSNPCLSLPFPYQPRSPSRFLSPPSTPSNVDSESEMKLQSISPVPSRRESQYDYELNQALPAPCEFADERASFRETSETLMDITENIELRIQSSTDNLMDVGEDEPYLFEEKSLSEIRDSLTTSLDTSIDIDEIENEEETSYEKRGVPDGEGKDEDKTENTSGDSEGTDDTVREKMKSGEGTDSDEGLKDGDVLSKEESEDLTTDTDTKGDSTTMSEQTTSLITPNETDLDLSESDGGDPKQRLVNTSSRLSQHDSLEEELKEAMRREEQVTATAKEDENQQPIVEKITSNDGESKKSAEDYNIEAEVFVELPNKDDKKVLEETDQISNLSVPRPSSRKHSLVKMPGVLETDIDDLPPRESIIKTPRMEKKHSHAKLLEVPSLKCTFLLPHEMPHTLIPSERIVEGAEAFSDEEKPRSSLSSRRISTGSMLKAAAGAISTLGGGLGGSRDKSRSPERTRRSQSQSAASGRHSHPGRNKVLPIINPLVSSPIWPNIATGGPSGGFIGKMLLANADTLCAAASPLMDLDHSSLEGFTERCVMNNYFGIGIDAKISLDFHNKREEHPEKCRSRTKNFMWYGVLASKELLCKTYKNLDQRVQLECDGERIPLPSLQGIVVLNIPSFMGGTNFWGGKKENDCFIAPSFDDRVLEVVAVFGSAQMAASRIINLQHHRIAQCSSVKITILGEEGVPVQVDGEAWAHPPGILRIVHKNRVQMLCRNRDLDVSLKAWEEKVKSQGKHCKAPSILKNEEVPRLAALSLVVVDSISCVRGISCTDATVSQHLADLVCSAQTCLDKVWRDHHVIEGPNLRMLATELVHSIKAMYTEISTLIKENSLKLKGSEETGVISMLSRIDCELKKTHEKDHLVHFIGEEEAVPPTYERRRSQSKAAIFKNLLKGGSATDSFSSSVTSTATTAAKPISLEKEVRKTWGVPEVLNWLDGLQLSEYKDAFASNDVRGNELLSLERRDLKELGVTKIGHIKRLQSAIKDIKDNKS